MTAEESFEARTSTWALPARLAFRTATNISPIGSVRLIPLFLVLPACLQKPRNLSLVGHFPETNAAQLEFPIYGRRTSAPYAPAVPAGPEFLRLLPAFDLSFFSHQD